jgi:5-methylcytosine-specific restriction enzyme A
MGRYDSLYNLSAWRTCRAAFLRAHPLCVYCLELGRHTAAQVVDHKTPHKGDRALFFDQTNWQALCTSCHNSHKQRVDRGGRRGGCDVNGMPLDPLHPWNCED